MEIQHAARHVFQIDCADGSAGPRANQAAFFSMLHRATPSFPGVV